MFSFLVNNLLWTQAPFVVVILFAAAIISRYLYKPFLIIICITFLFCLFFFRNPERICPEALLDPKVIVCPADGTIVDISIDPEKGFDGYSQKISIFLSPFNAHVNWIPISGTIERINYVSGKFMMAFLPKSSQYNEHNDIVIRHPNNQKILVRQIAGMVARRICCWVDLNQMVAAGQKYGMIKFSSRVDILLPANAHIEVGRGQMVYGGQTVIGRLE